MERNQNRNIVCFDLESTGTDPVKDRIVEIAMIILDRNLNQVHPLVSTYINPGIPIPKEASEVHGISDEIVDNAPTFGQVSQSLYEAIKDCDMLFYNGIRFDLPMLIEEFARVGIKLEYKDKMILDSYIVFSKKERRDLTAALKFYADKEMQNAHKAGSDVMATIDIIKGQMAMYTDLNTLEAINAISEPENRCDLAGKFVKKDGVVTINFGQKHFGEPALNQTGYLNWMLKGDFPTDTKNFINKLLNK